MVVAKTFQDLQVWRKAHEYVILVYEFTSQFPKNEQYGLGAQFRRSAVSIAANISEGFRKTGAKDKLRFFNTAQGSVEECRYYQILSNDLKYGNPNLLEPTLENASRLLNGYCKGILKRINAETA